MPTNRPESELSRALRVHSEAVREERTQIANDELLARGLTPKHCGVEASIDQYGDYVCRKCGADF